LSVLALARQATAPAGGELRVLDSARTGSG